MKRLLALCIGFISLQGAAAQQTPPQISTGGVLHLRLEGMVDPGMVRLVRGALQQATATKAQALIVDLNTYGGLVESGDSIATMLLRAPQPTLAYVNPNAISAGSLIAIACDSIYFASDGRMGATTVVEGGTGEKAPDKYQSFMRKLMAAVAEANGRNPLVAQKMVSEKLDLPGYSPVGQVLTLTVTEALALGYSEGEVQNIQELQQQTHFESAKLTRYDPGTLESAIQFLLRPSVSSVLTMLLMAGLFFELKVPGFGFPSLVAGVAAILLFAPHYIDGQAAFWELLLFAVGVGLLFAEFFIIPGFGVAGILGILSTVAALVLLVVHNDGLYFPPEVRRGLVTQAAVTISVIIVGGVGVYYISARLFSSQRSHPLVDKTALGSADGYTVRDLSLDHWIGREAVVATDLRPIGFIEVDGQRLSAISEGGWLVVSTAVEVVGRRGNELIVRPLVG